MKGLLKHKSVPYIPTSQGGSAEDRLLKESVEATYISHAGLPFCSKKLTYEPVQRILAVGSDDGRIKLLGKHGVEKTLVSSNHFGTRELEFLLNRGVLMRIVEDGELELWDLTTCEMISKIRLEEDDGITAAYCLPQEPYIFFGTRLGGLQIACLTSDNNQPAIEDLKITGVELRPYKVVAQDMQAKGEVLQIHVNPQGNNYRILLLHKFSGITIWELKSRTVVAIVDEFVEIEGNSIPFLREVTCTAWLSEQTSSFVTGHTSGDILHWYLPDTQSDSKTPKLLGRLRLLPGGEPAAPITSITYVSGIEDKLMVLGGHGEHQPLTLSLLSMPDFYPDDPTEAYEQKPETFPWFGKILGYRLVPQNGALTDYSDPSAVLVLTEGGKLMLHDLGQNNIIPLSIAYQDVPHVTCIQHAVIHREANDLVSILRQDRSQEEDEQWGWVLSGGQGPSIDWVSNDMDHLLFTGHADGRVRIWDLFQDQPQLLVTLQENQEIHKLVERQQGISCIWIDLQCGLLCVGYQKGAVAFYRWSETAQTTNSFLMKCEENQCSVQQIVQDRGWQLILLQEVHAAEVCAITVQCQLGYVAVGDKSGVVSLIALAAFDNQPSFRLKQSVVKGKGIIALQFVHVAYNQRASLDHNSTDQLRGLSILVASEDSCLAIIPARSSIPGQPFEGTWLKPKNLSKLLAVYCLKDSGSIATGGVLKDIFKFPWADEIKAGSQDMEDVQIDQEKVEQEDDDYLAQAAATVDSKQNRRQPLRGLLKKDRKRHASGSDSITHDQGSEGVPSPTASGAISNLIECSSTSVLVCCEDYLRTYSIGQIQSGDRTTIHKVHPSEPWILANAFSSTNGDGVACVSVVGSVQLYSLPSLQLLISIQLQQILGWTWDRETALGINQEIGNRVSKCTMEGVLLLSGLNNELTSVSVVVDHTYEPATAVAVYDQELATAAYAAGKALEQLNPQNEPALHKQSQENQPNSKGLSQLFQQVQTAAKAAADETIKGFKNMKQEAEKLAQQLQAGDDQKQQPKKHIEGVVTNQKTQSPSKTDTQDQGRVRLFGAPSNEPSRRAVRTTSEIKRAYGYQPKRNDDANEMMRENIQKLQQRGEKLEMLQDKTDQLESNARGFAEAAKKLAEQQQRKWWQL
eukprot:TRINITY_DN567_c0_g1_i4.p1 TRINITY_DN567_c0_g1~~TRINITY_DN567_c0_g1_i4.p1  ORF type:complete len:1139 (+),score=126.77 TRINITY_DN567_c0_g1_i4:44-3460(+)